MEIWRELCTNLAKSIADWVNALKFRFKAVFSIRWSSELPLRSPLEASRDPRRERDKREW